MCKGSDACDFTLSDFWSLKCCFARGVDGLLLLYSSFSLSILLLVFCVTLPSSSLRPVLVSSPNSTLLLDQQPSSSYRKKQGRNDDNTYLFPHKLPHRIIGSLLPDIRPLPLAREARRRVRGIEEGTCETTRGDALEAQR